MKNKKAFTAPVPVVVANGTSAAIVDRKSVV